MKLSCLVLAVFALVALFDVSGSTTTQKPKIVKPTKTVVKPIIKGTRVTTPKPGNYCAQYNKCKDAVEKTWASDGETCFFFQSKCAFLEANCYRMNQKEKILKKTTQQLCAPLCSTCVFNIDFVCAQSSNTQNTYMSFFSPCHMNYYICQTGDYMYPIEDVSKCGASVANV